MEQNGVTDLQTIVVSPSEPHTHTIVFLHGRGDRAVSFARSLQYSPTSTGQTLVSAFPSVRWVFPQSELRACAADWGGLKSQWFDVWDARNFSDREELQAAGLRESVASILKLLSEEVKLLNEKWGNIVLAGISQGAATSVHTLLNLDRLSSQMRNPSSGEDDTTSRAEQQQQFSGLGALMCFSARMPFANKPLDATKQVLFPSTQEHNIAHAQSILRNTPILLEHCRDDPLVLIEHGQQLRDTLTGFGAHVKWKEYPDGGHWFNSPRGTDDAVSFLNEHLAPSLAPTSVIESDDNRKQANPTP